LFHSPPPLFRSQSLGFFLLWRLSGWDFFRARPLKRFVTFVREFDVGLAPTSSDPFFCTPPCSPHVGNPFFFLLSFVNFSSRSLFFSLLSFTLCLVFGWFHRPSLDSTFERGSVLPDTSPKGPSFFFFSHLLPFFPPRLSCHFWNFVSCNPP